MLILFRLLLGIGESIYLPGGTKIVSMLFEPTERGLPCGLFDFGTRMGLVLGESAKPAGGAGRAGLWWPTARAEPTTAQQTQAGAS